MRRRIAAIIAVIVLAITAFTIRTLVRAGTFRSLTPAGPEPIKIIEGFPGGTEDVVFRPGGRELFVSSANFRDPTQPGGILLVDVQTGAVRDVTPKLDFSLQPHGLDLRIADGDARLFVVNHRNGSGFTPTAGDVSTTQHSVEVFDVAPDGTLALVSSHQSPAMNSPNDVAAVDATRFYVSNDHGYPPGFTRTIEDYLLLAAGTVVYYDGESFREVVHGTRYANGLTVTPDGKTLFLAETLGGQITRFARDLETGALTRVDASEPLGGLDNLALDEQGGVWATAHPKLLAFTAYAHDPSKQSPSQVYRVSPDDGWRVEEFYLTLGETMSGASIAAPGAGVVVMGAVFEGKLVVLPRVGD